MPFGGNARIVGGAAEVVELDEHERTMAFAELALGQIRSLRQTAIPRNYEIWYVYAAGYNCSLNKIINETLARNGKLTDPLTGLGDRKYFDRAVEDAVTLAIGEGGPLSLLMFDIDHFKSFNDNYGHLTGDQVLRLVAMSLKQTIRARTSPRATAAKNSRSCYPTPR